MGHKDSPSQVEDLREIDIKDPPEKEEREPQSLEEALLGE